MIGAEKNDRKAQEKDKDNDAQGEGTRQGQELAVTPGHPSARTLPYIVLSCNHRCPHAISISNSVPIPIFASVQLNSKKCWAE